ncbi:hypothetical protein GCK32_010652 [Trichostrongylus colubriformis]|uniref:Uncharacterized protein n=1 Tax=Trichostrongylus colubriformis TaxID=6319 RepID=A0AAN8FWQ5_TRICO
MKLLLLLFSVALVAFVTAEPRLRLSSAEEGLVRRAKELFKRRGFLGTPMKGYMAEKRRVRELFGKRSDMPPMPDDNMELPDYEDRSIDGVLMQLHRDRRGRVRELFG